MVWYDVEAEMEGLGSGFPKPNYSGNSVDFLIVFFVESIKIEFSKQLQEKMREPTCSNGLVTRISMPFVRRLNESCIS